MSDNKITQDQLEPNVMEELESGIGDLSTLSTENKDSLVAAVTEIYGKNVIAEAIGEPLAVTDTFSEMGSEINSLLSSFKTNMMNSGVTVESGDKFKQLIEKIKGLTEGEGNKGIQFAEGTFENLIIDNTDNDASVPLHVNLDLDFVPNMLFIKIGHSINADLIGGSAEAIICNMFDSTFYSNYSTNYGYTTTYLISDVTQTKCTITRKLNYNTSDEDTYLGTTILGFYAIGVGEEDTTLRDSLASILENKGVDVTEEDDIANLITKVENIKINYMVPGLNTTLCGPVNLQNIRDDSGSGGTVYEKTFTIPEFPTNYKGMRLSYNYSANWDANKTYPVIVTHERNGEIINTIESSDVRATSTVVYKNFDLGLDYIPGDIIRIKTQSLMINDLEYGDYHHIMNIMITYDNLIC